MCRHNKLRYFHSNSGSIDLTINTSSNFNFNCSNKTLVMVDWVYLSIKLRLCLFSINCGSLFRLLSQSDSSLATLMNQS
ncbi:hypothetical protein BLOT_007756 [Blomia tropicalis]|nr:hypothetical protein BLOT_007756 [Blomia tropicalis]